MYLDNDILNRIQEPLHQSEPGAKIYLYGSRARESASSESDWDLLILLQRDEITDQIEQSYTNGLGTDTFFERLDITDIMNSEFLPMNNKQQNMESINQELIDLLNNHQYGGHGHDAVNYSTFSYEYGNNSSTYDDWYKDPCIKCHYCSESPCKI